MSTQAAADRRTASSVAEVSARIDRLPPTRDLWAAVARVSFGGFFEIYEVALTTVLGPALVAAHIFHPGVRGLFGLPDQASFAFVTFAGLFFGALGSASATDRWGRRPIFTVALLWYASATVIMAFQGSVAAICLWRFVAAIGIGAEVVAVDSYLSELTPKQMRGRGFAFSKALQYLAVPVAAGLSVLVVKHGLWGFAGWQVLSFVPVIGALTIWMVRRRLPESPRWLAAHGRLAEADAILQAIEAQARVRTGRPLPEPVASAATQAGPASLAALASPQLIGRVATITVASTAGTVAFFGFGTWLPSLLEAQGVSVTKSLLYTAATVLTQPLTPLVILLFADRIQRKWQIIAAVLASACFGILFTRQTSALGWIGCGIAITAANTLMSAAMHTYRSEVFPTRLRGRAIGLVYSIDRIAAAFNSYVVGLLLVTFGVPGVFAFITAALLLCALTVGVFGPRSTGLATDDIGPAPSS